MVNDQQSPRAAERPISPASKAELNRPTTKECKIFIRFYNINDNVALPKIYTDQTGHFPKKSSPGNQYIMVMVELNSSTILVEAMKNRMAGEMICAY